MNHRHIFSTLKIARIKKVSFTLRKKKRLSFIMKAPVSAACGNNWMQYAQNIQIDLNSAADFF